LDIAMRLDASVFLCLVPVVGLALVGPKLATDLLRPSASPSANAVALPDSGAPTSGGSVKVRDRGDGHFQVEAKIGARRIPFMVDTGATLVALTWETARDLNLVSPGDPMTVDISTANGSLKARRITLDRLDVEGVEVDRVQALVLPEGALQTNLLGMSFLSRLAHFEISRGTLVLAN
jgi:aspartyl protease family protein